MWAANTIRDLGPTTDAVSGLATTDAVSGLAPAALQLTLIATKHRPGSGPEAKSGSQRLPVPRGRATCGLPGGYRKGITSRLP
jgi:hypothetical protein